MNMFFPGSTEEMTDFQVLQKIIMEFTLVQSMKCYVRFR